MKIKFNDGTIIQVQENSSSKEIVVTATDEEFINIKKYFKMKDNLDIIQFLTDNDAFLGEYYDKELSRAYTNEDGTVTFILADVDAIKKSYNEIKADVNTLNEKVFTDINKVSTALDVLKNVQIQNLETQVSYISEQLNPLIDISNMTIEEVRNYKIKLIGEECTKNIYDGFDVTTSKGIEHFSLTEKDQLNIMNLSSSIASGDTLFYHADKELVREFTVEEANTVIQGAQKHILVQTTYCNALNVWIRRCEDKNDILAISYFTALPDDLQNNVDIILGKQEETITEIQE